MAVQQIQILDIAELSTGVSAEVGACASDSCGCANCACGADCAC